MSRVWQANVFSLGYFRFYVVLTFILLILAAAIGIFLPVWEARGTITKLFQWQARPRARNRLLRLGQRPYFHIGLPPTRSCSMPLKGRRMYN